MLFFVLCEGGEGDGRKLGVMSYEEGLGVGCVGTWDEGRGFLFLEKCLAVGCFVVSFSLLVRVLFVPSSPVFFCVHVWMFAWSVASYFS